MCFNIGGVAPFFIHNETEDYLEIVENRQFSSTLRQYVGLIKHNFKLSALINFTGNGNFTS